MLVNRVKMAHFAYDAGRARHQAVVILESDTRITSLMAHSSVSRDTPRKDVILTLVDDAIRQVGRMPEHRSRPNPVRLADDALKTLLQNT